MSRKMWFALLNTRKAAPDLRGQRRRRLVVNEELAAGAAPGGALQVERAHYAAVPVHVPHLQGRRVPTEKNPYHVHDLRS